MWILENITISHVSCALSTCLHLMCDEECVCVCVRTRMCVCVPHHIPVATFRNVSCVMARVSEECEQK